MSNQTPNEKITASISREHLEMLRSLKQDLSLKYAESVTGSDVIMQAIACLFRQEAQQKSQALSMAEADRLTRKYERLYIQAEERIAVLKTALYHCNPQSPELGARPGIEDNEVTQPLETQLAEQYRAIRKSQAL